MGEQKIKELQTLKTVFIILAVCTAVIGVLILRRQLIRSQAITNMHRNTIVVENMSDKKVSE